MPGEGTFEHLDLEMSGCDDDHAMRTTLRIDDDVLRAARSLAEMEKKTVGEVISELARRGLRPTEPAISAHGIPAFDISPSAPPLTPEMVRQALDD